MVCVVRSVFCCSCNNGQLRSCVLEYTYIRVYASLGSRVRTCSYTCRKRLNKYQGVGSVLSFWCVLSTVDCSGQRMGKSVCSRDSTVYICQRESVKKKKDGKKREDGNGDRRIWGKGGEVPKHAHTQTHSVTHTQTHKQTNSDFTPRLKCQQGKLEMNNSFRVWNRLLLIYVRPWKWQIDSWGEASGKSTRQFLLYIFFWLWLWLFIYFVLCQTRLSIVIEVPSP